MASVNTLLRQCIYICVCAMTSFPAGLLINILKMSVRQPVYVCVCDRMFVARLICLYEIVG